MYRAGFARSQAGYDEAVTALFATLDRLETRLSKRRFLLGDRPTSVRERLEQHRRNPVCASCHATMDPLGFALENFDAVGRWRQEEAGTPVDASGALPDGTTFSGPIELRELLEQRQTQFVGTVIEKLLTYALGRGIEFHDMPAVRTIARQAAANDYRWSALVLGVVKSVPFQMKRSAGS